jgi:hypothetical protein
MIQTVRDVGGVMPTVSQLRDTFPALLNEFSDGEVGAALAAIGGDGQPEGNETNGAGLSGGDEGSLRPAEYQVLRRELNHSDLMVRSGNLSEYEEWMTRYFSRISLVDKLRETRAFTGFNRVFPDNTFGLDDRKRLIRKDMTPADWLPAYLVFGEGLFFEFNQAAFSEWERDPAVRERVDILERRYQRVQEERGLRPRNLSARFVMVHTFAHLLMNRLTYECGYSSAALRERIYIPDDGDGAGLLIYTAAGDAEGTMGGLVRMGKPGNLERTIKGALHEATWCAADPVCLELGLRVGQGPDSCNLAACHNCALVPETACEEFNRFLDRGLIVGDIGAPSLGAFRDLAVAFT